MSSPKVSLVIPIYNNEKDLHQALDSVLAQTMPDFEVFCVDDCSTDRSRDILSRYAERDKRFNCIFHEKNASAAKSRRDGVLCSSGQYVMFMDADDYLEPDAFAVACAAIEKKGTDIVQFGTAIENCNNLPDAKIKWARRFFNPQTDIVIRGNLLDACFTDTAERRLLWNMWNKLCRGDLCRTAFAKTEDCALPRMQDMYVSFVLLYCAKSCSGISNELYHYCYGRGQKGHETIDLKNFAAHCQIVQVLKAVERFVETLPQTEKSALVRVVNWIKKNLAGTIYGMWNRNLPDELKPEGLKLLCSAWGDDMDSVFMHMYSQLQTREAKPDVPAKKAPQNKAETQLTTAPAGDAISPKISLVIPVYNGEKHLREALDSVLAQTLTDFEIICVDDCSTDGSRKILTEYAKKDARVKYVFHEHNKMTLRSRKDGVIRAVGQYIMFMDQDDFYVPRAFETAYDAIRKTGTDLVQFGTAIENRGNITAQRIVSLKKFHNPQTEGIIRGNLLDACFTEPAKRRLNQIVWNKIYRANLCKKAFSETEDGSFPYSDDRYVVFLILYHAKACAGLNDELYHYNCGLGFSSYAEISLKDFVRYCSTVSVFAAIKRFAATLPQQEQQKVAAAVTENLRMCIDTCLGPWSRLPDNQKAEGLRVLFSAWREELVPVTAKLIAMLWNSCDKLSEWIGRSDILKRTPHAIKTVALYDGNSLANNETSLPLPDASSKYEFVLLMEKTVGCDTQPQASPKRIALPPAKTWPKVNFTARAQAWKDLLESRNIDAVVYAGGNGPAVFWDMFCVRIMRPHVAFVFCANKPYTAFYGAPNGISLEAVAAADSVVTTFPSDKIFWQTINPRTYSVGSSAENSANGGNDWNAILENVAQGTSSENLPPQTVFGTVLKNITHAHNARLVKTNAKLNSTVRLRDIIYARIDIKNEGSAANDIEILDISDPSAKIETPSWLCGKNGRSRVIKSNAGTLNLLLLCTGAGNVRLDMRGPDIRDENNGKIPVWIIYTKLVVDGRTVFDAIVPTWHDKSRRHIMHVRNGQVITVLVEWQKDCVTIGRGSAVLARDPREKAH